MPGPRHFAILPKGDLLKTLAGLPDDITDEDLREVLLRFSAPEGTKVVPSPVEDPAGVSGREYKPSDTLYPEGQLPRSLEARKQFPTAIGPGEGKISTEAARSVLGLLGDVTPGLGDVKAVGEAVIDPTLVNIGAAALGAVPVVGDVAGKTLKKVWTAADLEGVPKEIADRVLGKPKHGTVYHGTPHTFETSPEYPFGRFERGHIGKGEGGGMYGVGEGGYHAEHRNVGRTYQPRTLSMTTEVENAIREYDNFGFDTPGQAWDAIKRHDDWMERWDTTPYTPKEEKALKTIQERLTNRPGNLYESARHAADEEFLDWDKPFSEQSEKVQEALKDWRIGFEGASKKQMLEEGAFNKSISDKYGVADYTQAWEKMTPSERATAESLQTRKHYQFRKAAEIEPTGGEIYKSIDPSYSKAEASADLESKGIKGIKFLDQFSRRLDPNTWKVMNPKGEVVASYPNRNYAQAHLATIPGSGWKIVEEQVGPKTSNYVVFDPKDLEILRILGLSGMAIGAGGMAAAMGGREGGGVDELTQQMTQ